MGSVASPRGEYEAKSYWSRRLQDNFSLVGVGYQAFGARFNSWQYRAYLRNLERAEERFGFDLSRSSILECGFGTGFFLDYYHRRGNRAFAGVDLTDVSVENARKRYPEAEFRQGDLGAGPLDMGRQYDLVTAFAVLLHITDDNNFRCALANVCRHSSDWVLVSDIFPRKDFRAAGRSHYVLRSLDQYTEELHRNGFEVVGTEPIFVLLSTPGPAVRAWFYLWSAFLYLGCRTEFTGNILGATLYGLDGLLMRVSSWQPSTRLLVARRRPTV